jgi:hypothetical protein
MSEPFRQSRGRTLRLVLILAVMTALPALSLAMPRSNVVAVVGPAQAAPAAMAVLVARAGGSLVRAGGFDNIVVATFEEPGFIGRLYAAGAWAVLDPIVAGGCASQQEKAPRHADGP